MTTYVYLDHGIICQAKMALLKLMFSCIDLETGKRIWTGTGRLILRVSRQGGIVSIT